MSELENVRIGKMSELENVRIGKSQNWKMSELDIVRIANLTQQWANHSHFIEASAW